MDKLKSPQSANSSLGQAFQGLCQKLETFADLRDPLYICIAGGMAVHLHTGLRATRNVDAQFYKKIHVPNDLSVSYKDGADQQSILRFNMGYNPNHSLLPTGYAERSIKVDVGTKYIQPHILCINDLIISKISRFSKVDQEDIELLSMYVDCDLEAIGAGVEVALSQTVGSTKHVRQNADCVLELIRRSQISAI